MGDTIVSTGDEETYIFKSRKYWKLTDDAVAPGYPRYISSDWPGLADNLDASFTWTNGFTYFFKGNKYWRFNDRQFSVDQSDTPYPRDISTWWLGCRSQSLMRASSSNADLKFEESNNGCGALESRTMLNLNCFLIVINIYYFIKR